MAAPETKDCFKAEQFFHTWDYIKSPNGKYSLVLQKDGNFALHAPESRTIWASGIQPVRPAVRGMLRGDGNLLLFDRFSRMVWESGTAGKGNESSVVVVKDDGNAVICSDEKVIWTTDTTQKPDRLHPGESLTKDQSLTSYNGQYELVMQGDSNLVLYRNKEPIWAKGSAVGTPAEKLVFRADGELELLRGPGDQKWAAGTSGRGNINSFFKVRDDGNMVISTDDRIVWSSKTGPELPVEKTDRINGGNRLLSGEMLTSPWGRFTFTFQSDSKFVLYEGREVKWSSGVESLELGNGWVDVDKTGNMNIFSGVGRFQWSSCTRHRRNAGDTVLILQDDGVALLKLDGIVIWSTTGAFIQPYEPRDFEAVSSGDRVSPGQYLAVGQYITSKNGNTRATLQDNGQFVVLASDTNDILYIFNTPSTTRPSKLTFGYNDDMIIWGSNGAKIWQCTTHQADWFIHSSPGGIVLGDKGNVDLYSSTSPNGMIWSSPNSFPGFTGPMSELMPGEILLAGQKMLSRNGEHELSLSPSGYFRIRNTKFNSNRYYFTMQSSNIQNARSLSFGRDLALEIWDTTNRVVWRNENGKTDRPGGGPPRFILDNDASAYIRTNSDVPWSIDTLPSGSVESQRSIGRILRPGTIMRLDQYLYSNNGKYIARFNTNGEFAVINNHSGGPSRRGEQLWRAKASNTDSVWVTVDGNLCVGNGTTVRWQSNTGGKTAPGGELLLIMQDDGNLVMYVGQQSNFATGTSGGVPS